MSLMGFFVLLVSPSDLGLCNYFSITKASFIFSETYLDSSISFDDENLEFS